MVPVSIATVCLVVGGAAVSTGIKFHNVLNKLQDVPQVVR
jgi:hypothetical protein